MVNLHVGGTIADRHTRSWGRLISVVVKLRGVLHAGGKGELVGEALVGAKFVKHWDGVPYNGTVRSQYQNHATQEMAFSKGAPGEAVIRIKSSDSGIEDIFCAGFEVLSQTELVLCDL